MKFNDFVKGNGTEVDKFICLLLTSIAYFKSAHLETKSYARHKAYDFYYDEIQPLTDKFSEQWLGYSGGKFTPSFPESAPTDTITMLDLIVADADQVYKSMPNALKSVLDEITGVCFQTKYLLSLS